jgi:hypothetical protein
MKKETRGRKQKIHKPVPATFDEVLGAFGRSDYKEEKKLKAKKK